jgi:hypothetical protein
MSRTIVAARISRLPRCQSNLTPRAAPSLLAHQGLPLARPPWECRRLEAPGTPPLARTGARRRSPSRSGSHRHRPVNRRHYSGSRNCGHCSHRPAGVRVARALGQPPPSHVLGWAPSLMNRDGAWKTEPYHFGSSFIDAQIWPGSTELHCLT